MRKWSLALCGMLLAVAPGREEETVYFFFSPEAPGKARPVVEYVRRSRARFRPCLLFENLRQPGASTPEFLDTIRAVAPVSVYDREGLALARKFGIRRLPAVVVERGKSIHVSYGELSPCSK